MDGKQSTFVNRHAAGDTARRSLTRATASMPASGLFLTILYGGVRDQLCVRRYAFEPALTRAEEMDAGGIWQCATEIPEEWYERDRDGLNRLVETLYHRRATIRQLISKFRESMRNPFPNWRDAPHRAVSPIPRSYQELSQ